MSKPKDKIQLMNIREFQEAGYLQEVNRQFLHPLGLALSIEFNDENDCWRLYGIWDYRDDPEGIIFDHGILKQVKADRVHAEQVGKAIARIRRFGFIVQPIVVD